MNTLFYTPGPSKIQQWQTNTTVTKTTTKDNKYLKLILNIKNAIKPMLLHIDSRPPKTLGQTAPKW